jgi:hypothetical protein
MMVAGNTPSTHPSAGYLFTLAMGCAGLTFMAVGLGGVLIGRGAGDPDQALDVYGLPMFVFGFAILFAMRLIFWPAVPSTLRRFVRLLISTILAANIPLALLGLILAWRLPPAVGHADFPIGASILAALCQPIAALWLVRYRLEGI